MPIYPDVGGGGSDAPVGIPDYVQYVSPDGGSSAQGSQGAPKKYIYDAIGALIDNGGGTVSYANDSLVGGPVTDQGIWLRNDGIDVPGFIDIAGSRIRIVGNGSQSGQYVFERPGAARFIGGSNDFTVPGLWIVGTEVPIDFQFVKNFIPEFNGLASPVRAGWDYVRKSDFSIEQITVTNANRAAGETVLTVDLTTASSWSIISMDRDGNDNVVVLLTRPLTVAMSPWVPGSKIRVNTGGDTDFPNVDATVTAQSDVLNLQGETTITVTYVQAGATIAKSLSGTVKSHGCRAGDLIGIASNEAEFPTCAQMRVTASTVDTITVVDPYGYSPRSATVSVNPVANGVRVFKQLRGRQVASAVSFYQCSFFGLAGATDTFAASPTMDLGGTSASSIRLAQCYFNGGNNFDWSVHPSNYDPERTQAAIFASPGGSTLSGVSLLVTDCQSQAGQVIWDPQSTEATIKVNHWLQDSSGTALPTVTCENGTSLASVNLDNIGQADAEQYAIVIGTGYDQLKTIIGSVLSQKTTPVLNSSPITGPTNLRSATWNGASVPAESPWYLGWRGTWTGGLSTKHVGVNRAMGPVQARFTNLFPAAASWGSPPTGVTITQDGTAPDGSALAFKIVCDVTFVAGAVLIGSQPATLTASAGDYIAVGCWINSPDTTSATGLQMTATSPGDVVFSGLELDSSQLIKADRPLLKEGWQWCAKTANVQSIGNGHYGLKLVLPAGVGTYYVYAPTVVRAAIASPNGLTDLAEWAGTFKHQPQYLAAGMSGTMEGTKFIAHGGSGIATGITKVVGGSSGQLTLTGTGTIYEPRYGADGTTILGWVALLQATVN